jgi:hypothetical protein
MGALRTLTVGAEFRNPGRRSVALLIRVIVVRLPEFRGMCCGCSSPPWARAATAASEMQMKKTSKRAFMVFLLLVVVCFSRRILGRFPAL